MTVRFAALLAMTALGSFASLFLKRASGANGLRALIKNTNLYAGGFLYLLSAVLNIYLLRYLPYSVVLPLTSLTYVWTMILSRLVMGEIISRKKILGVACILAGAVCVSL